MQWTYNNQPYEEIDPDSDAIGFVYMIENMLTGRKYIGKKNLYAAKTSYKTVTVKSTGIKKKKKIRTSIQSDWKSYYGSSDELKKDVQEIGPESFQRTILRFCSTKGELSYYEAKYQFEMDVLLKPDMFYNRWISAKIHSVHLKHLQSSVL
jgi:hypothetical protein